MDDNPAILSRVGEVLHQYSRCQGSGWTSGEGATGSAAHRCALRYGHGSPGADDNASALAVLLEVADQLNPRLVTRPVWLAAFCLEEQGLLGSRAFACT